MGGDNKESNTLDGKGSNIQKILDGLADKVKVKNLPEKITEQYSFVCINILEVGENENIFFSGININYKGKWLKASPQSLVNFIIDVAIKFGVDENKLYRDHKRLFKIFSSISKSKFQQKLKDLPKLKEEEKNDGPPLVMAHRYVKKSYPKTRYNIISETVDFGVKDKNFDDVITELRMKNIKVSSSEFETYLRSDKVEKYDPFEEYFKGLNYDGETDYIQQLASHVKVKNPEFWESMFKKHMVRSVAQAMGDGKFSNRFVLVLRSTSEFIGKSTFIRYLEPFNGQYYVEQLNKDVDLALTKNFILNIEEIESMNTLGFNKLKSIISMTAANMRTFFTQNFKNRIRRCSIWASTNNIEFLGAGENTRWIILNVTSIDFSYNDNKTLEVGVDIDKVWAQAYHLFKTGFDYELTKKEWKVAKGISKVHRFKSNEAEFISEYLHPSKKYFATPTEVSQYFQIVHKRILNAQKIGTALTGMEYEKKSKHGGIKGYMIETRDGESIDAAVESFKSDNENQNGAPSVGAWCG